jgi:phage-related protein
MTADQPRKIPVVFYRTRHGAEVVRDWLRALNEKDRNAVGQDLMRVQYRWPVGMPLCRALGDGLWEVRSELPSHRIARVVFSVEQGKSWFCTASSRSLRKRQVPTWLWRANARESLNCKG